ncbi:MAG: alpha/beta hydrolase fold protein [uncultured bacterium]|nr:MAG: alpha/beta hydrolase fold protein [uncultured bacterium]
MSLAHHNYHYVSNGAGWQLELKQCRPPQTINEKKNPLLIIPGYGMNSFIFGYHPHGLSMEEYLTQRGFEVWSLNLRAHGGSIREKGGHDRFTLKDLALVDLKIALDYMVKNVSSKTGKIDLLGCSLGGTIAYIYAALSPRNHCGSIVSMGTPMRWEDVHPLVKLAFLSPKLVGCIRVAYTKELIRLLFPFIVNSPFLKIYLHKEMVDLRNQNILLESVENPNRYINKEIAEWVKKKDLFINGKNLTQELKKIKNPLLCIVANSDGVVPAMTALSAHEVIGSKIKETLVVGTDNLRFAHADLFVSNHCHEMVFKPVAEWLANH